MSTRWIDRATVAHRAAPEQPATVTRLRSAGIRVTAARRAVIAALHQAEGHSTVEQLASAAPETDVSSVYRTLELLVDVGAVQQVQTLQGPTAYHLLHDAPAHAHAQCSTCGLIVDVPATSLVEVSQELKRSLRFDVATTDVTLVGHCADCRISGRT